MLSIDNVLKLHGIPEGAIVYNAEYDVGDHGVFTRVSGTTPS